MTSKNSENKILAAIILAAFAIRLAAILYYGDFWDDEMFSVVYSQKPWLDSIHFWLWETNPPLHMFFLKLWFYIFPLTEFWARMPSLIFGVLTVWWIYKIGRDYFSERVGQIAAILIALHPYHIFISIFGRAYSLLLCLSAISIYYCFKIYVKNEYTKKDLIILTAVNLLLCYAHLTGFLLIIGEGAVILFLNAKRINHWVLIHLIPLALWLIWAIPSLAAKAAEKDTFGSAWFLNFHNNFLGIFTPLKLIFFGPGSNYYIYFLIAIFFILLIKYFIKQVRTDPTNKYFTSTVLIFSIPLIASLIMSLWNIRFIIIALPAFVIVSACLLSLNINRLILATGIATAVTLCGVINLFSSFPLNNWAKLNNFLTANYSSDKNQVFIANDFIEELLANKYYGSPMEKIFYTTPDADTNWDKSIITGNYRRYLHDKQEMAGWYAANNISQYDELFLLYSKDVGVELPDILASDNWKLISTDRVSPAKDERVILRYAR